jgi:hypothetical protein
MKPKNTTFSDRLSAAAEAKQAMLAKFKPKPMITASEPIDRQAEREARLEAVRVARAAEREAARAAQAAAEEAARQAALEAEQAVLAVRREERKERKAGEKASAQAKRQERLAAYGKLSVG